MKVLITDQYHGSSEEECNVFKDYGIKVESAMCKSASELIRKAKGFDALLASYVQVTKDVLESLPDVRLVVKYGVGVDNIDLIVAKEQGGHVVNVPDYCSEEVAVHALALTLSALRKLSILYESVKKKTVCQQLIMRLKEYRL